jgi:hypothetical protein
VVILVVVDALTIAAMLLLNFTSLLPGVALKPVPVIVTVAPTAPLVGAKLEIVGVTVKFEALFMGCPPTVTDIGEAPAVTPAGTVVLILVVVEDDTVALIPFMVTVLFAGVALKPVPVMVIAVPTGPLAGVKLAIVGVTVKFEALFTTCPPTVTAIGPAPAVIPAGTVMLTLVVVEDDTVALKPLMVTVLFTGVALKPVPLMVIAVPTFPLLGAKPDINGSTIKSGSESVSPATLTETVTLPAVRPAGTEVVMLVEVAAVTTAGIPPKVTSLSAGVSLKLVPEMIMDVPITPLVGLKLSIVGCAQTEN